MDDALPVGRVECFGNLPRHLNGFVERQRSPGDALLKRLALDDLENQETAPLHGFETINRRDVGMIQRREQSRFPLKLTPTAPEVNATGLSCARRGALIS